MPLVLTRSIFRPRRTPEGLERNDFYITYEPVGHMFRNSRGITPRNNFLLDSFWSLAGTVSLSRSPLETRPHGHLTEPFMWVRQVALPIWGWMSADGEVKKEAKKIAATAKQS